MNAIRFGEALRAARFLRDLRGAGISPEEILQAEREEKEEALQHRVAQLSGILATDRSNDDMTLNSLTHDVTAINPTGVARTQIETLTQKVAEMQAIKGRLTTALKSGEDELTGLNKEKSKLLLELQMLTPALNARPTFHGEKTLFEWGEEVSFSVAYRKKTL